MTDLPVGEQMKQAHTHGHYLTFDTTLDQMQREIVTARLEYFKGNKTAVAASLGITIKTLYNWMHRYNLFDKWKKSKGKQ